MLNQNFSPETLSKFLHSKRDNRKLKKQNKNIAIPEILTDISYSIDSQDFKFESISTLIINNKTIAQIEKFGETLILRKLNDNLKRIYGVKQSNRREITKQVHSLLQETNPLTIIRLDIKGFYENIDLGECIDPILEGTLPSPTSKKILRALQNTPQVPAHVPRGVNISATLTEIHMRDFDRKARSLPGVYYYARYVDDIIIFSYKSIVTEDLKALKTFLPKGLKFHGKKTHIISIQCRCLNVCSCTNNCKRLQQCTCAHDTAKNIKLDYLGYIFNFSDIPKGHGNKKPKLLTASLAKRKIDKIKTRIIMALLDFSKTCDFQLLKDRMYFLTGNCEFRIKGDFSIRSGIHYNYPLINADDPALSDLTLFLRKSVHSKKGSLGNTLNGKISNSQRSELGRLCFRSGFKNKITYAISEERLSSIKECWKNA
ncbi:MAG: antiviral reverse transcriptase Drt3a [Pseudomonadaceae bacterium]